MEQRHVGKGRAQAEARHGEGALTFVTGVRVVHLKHFFFYLYDLAMCSAADTEKPLRNSFPTEIKIYQLSEQEDFIQSESYCWQL